ncbi:MAG: glycerophosphodiester phosphodiesterase [Myxococcota bacterium]|nr:glycerophosphodiester phosphodiesterase [Myxococcota bacterium]
MKHPFFHVPHPIVLGHRGAAGSAPENTLFAFREGLSQGAHLLESDIQITADGVPILLHDSQVDRTTEGHGEAAQLSLKEIQSLDAGCRFTPAEGIQASPRTDAPLRIPTLREAFEEFPETPFNLEIKGESRALVSAVVALVQEFDREDRTLLTAGEDPIQALLREELKRTNAHPALGASLADILEVIRSAQNQTPPQTDSMALQIPRLFGDGPLVTPELLAHCHQYDIEVHVWTINDPDEMAELLDLGVDGLVTDTPGVMTRLLADRA